MTRRLSRILQQTDQILGRICISKKKVFLLATLILNGAIWPRATFMTNALVRDG